MTSNTEKPDLLFDNAADFARAIETASTVRIVVADSSQGICVFRRTGTVFDTTMDEATDTKTIVVTTEERPDNYIPGETELIEVDYRFTLDLTSSPTDPIMVYRTTDIEASDDEDNWSHVGFLINAGTMRMFD